LGGFRATLPQPKYFYPRTVQVGLKFGELEAARAQIEQRVDQMFAAGLWQEFLKVKEMNMSRTARAAIGYAQLFDCLDGPTTLAEATQLIKLRTFQLYKYQLKWFGKDPRIMWRTVPAKL
jgi:tRNA dimethylallyltransferase